MSIYYNPELNELALYDEFTARFSRDRRIFYWSPGPMIEAGWEYIGEL